MKLNEKGFAISTILYGLLLVGVLIMALLMNTASFNLMTTKDFVDKTEKELNAVADSYYGDNNQNCTFPGGVCTAERTGYYKVNLYWNGKYASGIIFLVVGQKLYYVNNNEIRLSKKAEDSSSAIMSLAKNYISGSTLSITSTDKNGKDATYHNSDKYFINGMITNGSGTTNMTYMGNSDEKENKRDSKFNNIRYVEACGSAGWTEIQVISGGKNVAYGKPIAPVLGSILDPNLCFITDNNLDLTVNDDKNTDCPPGGSAAGTSCIIVDIGRDMNTDELYKIDQIGVFGNGVQPSINLYTEDKEQIIINNSNCNNNNCNISSMTVKNGYYFNAYKNDTWS